MNDKKSELLVKYDELLEVIRQLGELEKRYDYLSSITADLADDITGKDMFSVSDCVNKIRNGEL